jgi:hypothetical protein
MIALHSNPTLGNHHHEHMAYQLGYDIPQLKGHLNCVHLVLFVSQTSLAIVHSTVCVPKVFSVEALPDSIRRQWPVTAIMSGRSWIRPTSVHAGLHRWLAFYVCSSRGHEFWQRLALFLGPNCNGLFGSILPSVSQQRWTHHLKLWNDYRRWWSWPFPTRGGHYQYPCCPSSRWEILAL